MPLNRCMKENGLMMNESEVKHPIDMYGKENNNEFI